MIKLSAISANMKHKECIRSYLGLLCTNLGSNSERLSSVAREVSSAEDDEFQVRGKTMS
jgi:hypothetical protein